MSRPRVLIGVPTLNGPDRLKRCLESVRDCTDTKRFDVRCVIADDGSTEMNLAGNHKVVGAFLCIPGMTFLHGHGRTGIASTWNRIVRSDDREIIALINDDIEVVPDWLEVIEYSLSNNAHVGMVGLNSYLSVTKQQVRVEGRMPLTIDYKEARLRDGDLCCAVCDGPLRSDYYEARLMNGGGSLIASTGSCFGFRRKVYDQVGGFDERYHVFFEEVDFGVSLQRAGYFNYMASYPLVYHTGGETNSDPKNLIASERLVESREKFQAKWKKTPSQLREEFMKRGPAPLSREWNSMIRNLK
jgi:GT2 family glycosyltransferase